MVEGQIKRARRLGRQRFTNQITIAMVVAVAMAAQPGIALAAPGIPPKPPTDQSYYPGSASSATLAFYGIRGCDQAAFDIAHHHNSEVILGFGGQTPFKNQNVNYPKVGTEAQNDSHNFIYSDIVKVAVAYADNYARCDVGGLYNVRLAVGTSNDLTINTAAGNTWYVNAVLPVINHVLGTGDGNLVHVYGGSDLETEYSSPASAEDWAEGYDEYTNHVAHLDFGDAGGCMPTHDAGFHDLGSSCNRGWYQHDVWLVGYYFPSLIHGAHAPSINPAPQIYTEGAAQAWAQTSLWAYYHNKDYPHVPMYFQGPLDQNGAPVPGQPVTFYSAGAWHAFAEALISAGLYSGGQAPVVNVMAYSLTI
jgi:hypothetical protein